MVMDSPTFLKKGVIIHVIHRKGVDRWGDDPAQKTSQVDWTGLAYNLNMRPGYFS